MIMLPIVIVYLEELLDGGAPYRYSFALGLTVLLQFYMGYMISIFVALYACFYVSPRLMIDGDLKAKNQNSNKINIQRRKANPLLNLPRNS